MKIEDLIKLREYLSRFEKNSLDIKVCYDQYKILRKYWGWRKLTKKDFNKEGDITFNHDLEITLKSLTESQE